MTPEMKTKWVAALRSGSRKQTTGSLKDAEGYCCLGVLASINGYEPNVDGLIESEELGYGRDTEGLLPEPLAEKFGISKGWMSYFAGENDDNSTFLQIADELEVMMPEKLARPT